MATARVLFNDAFHPRAGGGGWNLRVKLGNDKPIHEIFATWQDGNLATTENFMSASAPNLRVVDLYETQNSEGSSFALINTTMLGMAVSGQVTDELETIAGPNFLYISTYSFSDMFINTPADSMGGGRISGSISMIFVGTAHALEIDYPVGWRPPFVQSAREQIRLPKTGYPIGRRSVIEPMRLTVPITLREREYARGTLKELIERMQQEPFIFRWDENDDAHDFYGWLDSHGGFKMTAGGLMDITLNMQGYVRYDNMPISV